MKHNDHEQRIAKAMSDDARHALQLVTPPKHTPVLADIDEASSAEADASVASSVWASQDIGQLELDTNAADSVSGEASIQDPDSEEDAIDGDEAEPAEPAESAESAEQQQ